jgi:hypothetical protein
MSRTTLIKPAIFAALDEQLESLGIQWRPVKEVPPFYYDGKLYHYADDQGNFYTMDFKSLTRRLIACGFYELTEKGRINVDPYVILIQDKHAVCYAGALSGFSAGIHELSGGRRILVTETIRPIEPMRGEWPVLRSITDAMLVTEEIDQRPYLYGWLKIFAQSYFASLEKGMKTTLIPGQALGMAGARDSGKTLLKLLIKKMFGDRSAHPYQYMLGGTGFNAELCEAPILEIDDQAASKDPRDRNTLAARVKEFTVGSTLRVHPKYQKPIDLRPCVRLIICVNDEPSALTVLPTLDPGVEDKLMLLKVEAHPMPMPTGTTDERNMFWDTLVGELPAFMHFLLHEFEIPANLTSGRFGVQYFHHPDIVAALEDFAPESRVFEMINELFASGRFSTGGPNADPERMDLGEAQLYGIEPSYGPTRMPWMGRASEFEEIIRGHFAKWDTERLFRYGNSAGMLLRSLSMKYPNRFKADTTVRGNQRWIIQPPPELRTMQALPDRPLALEDPTRNSD